MNLNFEQLYKANLLPMKINRTHPFIKRDRKWLIQFTIAHGLYFTVFVILIRNVILNVKIDNFTETCKNSTLCVVFCANTLTYFILLWKQSKLAGLILDVKKDYLKARSLPQVEQDVIYQYAIKGRRVCRQWFVIVTMGVLSFMVKSVFSMLLSYIQGDFVLVPYHDMVYPSIIEDRKYSIPMFIFTYLLMLAYAFYSASLYLSFVPLGPILMTHAAGQLVVIKNRVDVIFESGDTEQIRVKMYDIIKQLQYIYDFVDRINVSFKFAYEATLKLSSITLPIVCYEIIETLKHGEISIEFIAFVVGSVSFSSSPCYYSDQLMEKGEELRQSIYFCGWEKVYSRRLHSTIRVMLQRAYKPVAIHCLFRVLSLEALADVFHHAYTLFNLMNAAWR